MSTVVRPELGTDCLVLSSEHLFGSYLIDTINYSIRIFESVYLLASIHSCLDRLLVVFFSLSLEKNSSKM